MEWSGEFIGTDLGLSELKKALENELNRWGKGYELLYMSFKLGVVYAAMKNPKDEVFAVIQLWTYSSKHGELLTKTMTDDMGPAKSEPPKKLLKMLSPTTNEYALNWRKSAWKEFKNIPDEYKEK